MEVDQQGPGVIALAWMIVLGSAGGSVALMMNDRPPPVSAPAAFKAYTAGDKSFVCQAPEGWRRRASSSGGIAGGVRFEKGAAYVELYSDLQGSLLGDIAAAGNASLGNLEGIVPGLPTAAAKEKKAPVEVVHEADKTLRQKLSDAYQESAAKPLASALGEGRISEYTDEERRGQTTIKLHGYRVTILGTERRFGVDASCPETDWAALKPAYEKVIASLAAPAPARR